MVATLWHRRSDGNYEQVEWDAPTLTIADHNAKFSVTVSSDGRRLWVSTWREPLERPVR